MNIGLLIFAYILTCAISLTIHKNVYKSSCDKKYSCCEVIIIFLKNMFNVLNIFSPDYSSASIHKSMIEDHKRHIFIKCSNSFNLLFSFLLVTTLLLCSTDSLLLFVKYFLGIRIISRFLEIIIAFGKDVVTEKGVKHKISQLDKYDRLQLALKSLLEISLLSAGMYAALNNEFCFYQIVNSLIYSIGTSLLVAINFKEYGDDVIFSFANEEAVIFNFYVIFQVFTSATLIILAIAGYLSDGHKKIISIQYVYGNGDGI